MIINFARRSPDVKIPKKATIGSSGVDLRAFLPDEHIMIHRGVTELVPTGLVLEIPRGYEGQVRSRSGLALQGITVANSPGTIDSDFRGEVKILLRNTGDRTKRIKNGDRVAQMVFVKIEDPHFIPLSELSNTKRGEDGLGSTGVEI